jgi:type VI secretion system protein ImpA
VTTAELDALLEEISPDAPCGEDISYDADFLDLEQLVKGTAESQVGDHIHQREEPDWKEVRRQSLKLLERSRDIRLVLYLTVSMLCLKGLSGFCDGLALLRGLVERYWDHFFPQLDPEDDKDPLERMNIIGALSPPPSVMSDQDQMKFLTRLMSVPLCRPEDARLPHPSLRDILAASGELSVPEKDASTLPSMKIIDAAFEQADIEALKDTHQMLFDCLYHLHALDQMLIERVGASSVPDFSRLENLLRQMQSKTGLYMERRGYGADGSSAKNANGKAGGDPAKGDAGRTPDGAVPTVSGPGLTGSVASNQDVQKALDMIISYYERSEPSSPVPLLIKRAKRLVGKSFVDIIRDISPDAMSQVQMVSGEEDQMES